MSGPTVTLPIEDGPNWISHVEVSRDPEGQIVFEIVKRSGETYGFVRIEQKRLVQIADFL